MVWRESFGLHKEEDDVLRLVMSYCWSGWPEHRSVTGVVKSYSSVSLELMVQKGILMRRESVVISAALCIATDLG